MTPPARASALAARSSASTRAVRTRSPASPAESRQAWRSQAAVDTAPVTPAGPAAVEDHQSAGELRLQPGDRDPQPHQVSGQGLVRPAGHLLREQPVQHRVEAAGTTGTAAPGATVGTAPCTRTHVR